MPLFERGWKNLVPCKNTEASPDSWEAGGTHCTWEETSPLHSRLASLGAVADWKTEFLALVLRTLDTWKSSLQLEWKQHGTNRCGGISKPGNKDQHGNNNSPHGVQHFLYPRHFLTLFVLILTTDWGVVTFKSVEMKLQEVKWLSQVLLVGKQRPEGIELRSLWLQSLSS